MKEIKLINEGYKVVKESYCKGYVSRRSNAEARNAIPYKGRVEAEYYVLCPAWNTTRYCIKKYYAK